MRSLITALIGLSVFVVVLMWIGPATIRDALAAVETGALARSALAVALAIGFAVLRFRSVLRAFGHGVRARTLLFAFAVGHLSNLTVANVVGQGVGRGAILARAGVPFEVTMLVTLVERAIGLVVLGVIGVAGALVVFGEVGIDPWAGADYPIAFALGLAATSGFVGATVLRTRIVRAARGLRLRHLVRVVPVVLWSAAIYLTMVGAFMALILPGSGDKSLAAVFGVASLVVFAGSLPISFSGWGVRELSAAAAFAAVGLPPQVGVASSIVFGIIGLAATAVMTALVFILRGEWQRGEAAPVAAVRRESLFTGFLWVLAAGVAVTVFFQLRVPVEAQAVTLNLADLGALIALALVLWHGRRRVASDLLVPPGAAALGVMTGVIVLSLAVAWVRFGGIEWGWINRGFGWIVLLGYVACGAGIVAVAGTAARTRLLATLAAAAFVIALLQLAYMALVAAGMPSLPSWVMFQAEGFALNRNAFAFQLFMALIALMIVSSSARGPIWAVMGFVCVLAAYLTYSRTAWVVLVLAVPLLPLILDRGRLRWFLMLLVVSAVCAVLVSSQGWRAGFGLPESGGSILVPANTSDVERLQTIRDGIALWLQHPVFGAGLGGYVQERLAAGESFQVIHNVAVWLLAETGLVGTFAVLGAFLAIAGTAWRKRSGPDGIAMRGALAVLVVFVLFGLAHDVFAQRIGWFMLGLLLARPGAWARSVRRVG